MATKFDREPPSLSLNPALIDLNPLYGIPIKAPPSQPPQQA
jgi:hypothetical protein